MKIHFTKMQGLGNDFVVIDCIRQSFQPTSELIQQWANRRTGIGFDQLLLAEPAKDNQSDFFYRIFNADGSEVSQCGNGARCLAQFLRDQKLTDKNVIRVATHAGLLELQFEHDKHNRLITVNLGAPIFEAEKIPFKSPLPPFFKGGKSQPLPFELELQKKIKNLIPPFEKVGLGGIFHLPFENQTIECCVLSLGNPHCVITVTDINTAPVQTFGKIIAESAYFPESVNVSFMQIVNSKQIRLRVFERGAGETLACGSGACAAVIAGRLLKQLDAQVNVEQSGGLATVYWAGENSSVYLTGPAITVFTGAVIY